MAAAPSLEPPPLPGDIEAAWHRALDLDELPAGRVWPNVPPLPPRRRGAAHGEGGRQ